MGQTGQELRIAVLGAGAAGLTCARILHDRGRAVTVLDKGRGIGGRVASRRVSEVLAFDHGAPSLPENMGIPDDWSNTAVPADRLSSSLRPWKPFSGRKALSRGRHSRLVGVPTMNAPLKALAEGIDVRLGAEIAEVEREESGWRLILSDGTMLPVFDRVISTIPAPQAQQVYAAFPSVTEPLSAVKMAPCWTVMLAFEEPVDPGFDLACNPTPLLSLLVRNSSKPGRAIDQHCWVAHARAAWSRECLEMRADEVLPLLLNEVGGAFGRRLPSVLYAAAHRWRYARTETPLGRPFLSMANGTLLLGGDWALGPDISHAIESGAAMARAILEELRTCLV